METANEVIDVFSRAEIRSGVTYLGITYNELDEDIKMLLDNELTTVEELKLLCESIGEVNKSLTKLSSLVELHLPHKTNGRCNGLKVGRNRLLSMFFGIRDSANEFQCGISLVNKRVEKILVGKEQFALSFE